MSELQPIENESLEEKVIRLENTIEFYKNKLIAYEQNGAAKAAYSINLSLIHISEPTRPCGTSRMPSSA